MRELRYEAKVIYRRQRGDWRDLEPPGGGQLIQETDRLIDEIGDCHLAGVALL